LVWRELRCKPPFEKGGWGDLGDCTHYAAIKYLVESATPAGTSSLYCVECNSGGAGCFRTGNPARAGPEA
jgi:hypothetical protein